MGISDYTEKILPSVRSVIIFFFVVYIPLYIISITYFRRGPRKSPFTIPSLLKRSHSKFTFDKRVRDAILRQHFNMKRIPDRVDVIVIGSNIGGLVTAGLLARTGLRVLVLERQSFVGSKVIEKECESKLDYFFEDHFGNMNNNSILRLLMDQLTNEGLDWTEIESDFDSVCICKDDRVQRISVTKDRSSFESQLTSKFPDEVNAIKSYFKLLDTLQKSLWTNLWTKVMPLQLIHLLEKIRIFSWFSLFFSYSRRSLIEVLDELTSNEELKMILTYPCHIMHASPYDISFVAYAFRMNQLLSCGGFYPTGGFDEIAFYIVSLIQSAKGKVLVSAPVEKLIYNENRVTGVQVLFDNTIVDIYAKKVILAEGINKVRELLPDLSNDENALMSLVKEPQSDDNVTISIHVWIDSDTASCQLRSQNTYFYFNNELGSYQIMLDDWTKLSSEDASGRLPPCVMMSSPSAKDPKWCERHEEKSSLLILCFKGPNKWANDIHRRDQLKKQFFTTIWTEVCKLHPHFNDLPIKSTHFSFDHNLNLPNDVSRYSVSSQSSLRPNSGINGLLVTGSDVFISGYMGEIYGAMLCASHYLNRNLMSELVKIKRKVEKGTI